MNSAADAELEARAQERLDACLGRHASLAVAFSGGVDSSVLLHAGRRRLGARCVGLIADSASLPRRELAEALDFARSIDAPLTVLRTDELDDPGYAANAGQRCYHCKRALFEAMSRYAQAHGIATLAFGEITDDWLDERPGRRAAREFEVVAPLAEAGFDKRAVRAYARRHALSVAEKPASACLASRLPLLRPVTAEALSRIERAEESLRALGLSVLRVRDHGEQARVEVGSAEFACAEQLRPEIAQRLGLEGFASIELAPYRSPLEKLRASST